MAIPDKEFKAANRRGANRLRRSPIAIAARYDRKTGRVVINLARGLEITFRPQDAEGLETAKPEQLTEIEVSPSGLGIHFPRVDADIYIPALLEGFLGSKRWMASELGKLGGRISTRAKADAARQNGRLGGRPRKAKEPAAA